MSFSKKDKQGVGLIAGVLAILGALFAFNMHLSSRPKADDRNCISPVRLKTVFVIDQSDSIPAQTIAEIKRRIENAVKSKVAENELVTIFQISDRSRTNLEPIFSRCKPRSEGNGVTERDRDIRKQFEDGFNKPLEEALSSSPVASPNSPIGEVFIDLSLTDYLRGDENRLVVFSDLMQNSENARMYECTNAKDAIAAFRDRRAGAVERPTFRNTDIVLNFVPREGISRQAIRCRDGFWSWFFGDNEGPKALLTPDYLPGGAKM